MPADNEPDALDRWLNQQVTPLPPPDGTFDLVTRRARRRKIRKAMVSAASAGAVAAAVAVAIPLSSSLHLSTSPTNASMAAGARTATSSSGKPTAAASTSLGPSTASAADSGTPSPTASVSATSSLAAPGSLPADFRPTSVTWDSTTTGWVMGPAGTPGHCANANPNICTSIARTDDGGQTWHGLPAPSTTGVNGLAFLNASYGWAFGPELWATDDGGQHWHQVNTGGLQVSELQTFNGRAYALFASCTSSACTSDTVMTAVAGSDTWTPVAGVPAELSRTALTQVQAPVLVLDGTTGYLVGWDGTLYAGPVDGTAWHQAGKLPCAPGAAYLLAPDGTATSSAQRLAVVCTALGANATVYVSQSGGTAWTSQPDFASQNEALKAESLATLPDGTLIVAAMPADPAPGGGIYLLPPGATQWQAATLAGAVGGFAYVGMTTATQGVAIGADASQYGIWMTADGGKTWQFRPIQS